MYNLGAPPENKWHITCIESSTTNDLNFKTMLSWLMAMSTACESYFHQYANFVCGLIMLLLFEWHQWNLIKAHICTHVLNEVIFFFLHLRLLRMAFVCILFKPHPRILSTPGHKVLTILYDPSFSHRAVAAFSFQDPFYDFVVSDHSMNYPLPELHYSNLLTLCEADSTRLP